MRRSVTPIPVGTLKRAARGSRRRALRGYHTARFILGGVERVVGVNTSPAVKLADLGIADVSREDYEPSGWLDLRRILRPREVRPGEVFLDLGSGKGRILLEAARYPFRRVIGVELSPELNAIARANIEAHANRLRCREIELVTCDVVDYQVPDDVTVAYVYNAFGAAVFEAALARLIESLDRRPRRLRLIYRNALEHDAVMRTGRFRELRVAPGLRPSLSIRMYGAGPGV